MVHKCFGYFLPRPNVSCNLTFNVNRLAFTVYSHDKVEGSSYVTNGYVVTRATVTKFKTLEKLLLKLENSS